MALGDTPEAINSLEGIDYVSAWFTIPIKPKHDDIKLVDMTAKLFDVRAGDTKRQLVFPDVPRGREQIEVQWVWIFGKPKYGKTTKSWAIVNYALRSGKYDLSKTQIMKSEDLVAMMENIRHGTEVAIMVLDDAHKYQSVFSMTSKQGREHADMTFLARHIFRNKTGNPYGVLIIIANAQELRSIHKWIRDQAVVIGYCGLIFEDPLIPTMPKAYVKLLSEITTHVEEYKDQKYKSYMVVLLPHKLRDKRTMTVEEYNDPDKTPIGYVKLTPLKRLCPTCRTIYKEFYASCPTCHTPLIPVFEYRVPETDKIVYVPYNKVVEEIEGITTTVKDIEELTRREELADKLYNLTIKSGIDPLKREFLDILTYYATSKWLKNDMDELNRFTKDKMYFYRTIRGRYASEKHINLPEEDEDIENPLSTDINLKDLKPKATTSIHYNPNFFEIFNNLILEGHITNQKHIRMFRDYYFDENGLYIRNPDERKFTVVDIARKYGVDRSRASHILSQNGSIWQKIAHRVGHEYEKWVADHLKYNNIVPIILYDNVSERQVFLGGGISEPDVIAIGTRDGKIIVDIISLKVMVNTTSNTFFLMHPDKEKNEFNPELNTFLEALKSKQIIISATDESGKKRPYKINFKDMKLNDDVEVSFIIIVRGTGYDEFEVAYRFTDPEQIPQNITVSHNKFLKKQKPKLERYIEKFGDEPSTLVKAVTNDPEGVAIFWKPL